MKTRITVTLEDDGTMNTSIEGERIGQVVLGLLRYAQLCTEQELTMSLWLSRIDSPLITAIAEKISRLNITQRYEPLRYAPPEATNDTHKP